MQHPPSLLRRLARVLVGLAAVAILAGCSFLGPVASGPLVSIDAHGGHCIEGECRTVTTIDRSGKVEVEGSGEPLTRTVDPGLASALAAAVDAADYARITAVPFTGECPTAYDGQERTYTFHPAGRGPVTFSSCEVAIDPADPLFRTLDAVLLALSS